MGSSFVLFDVSMEITLGQFRSGKSGYTLKSLPVGKRYLPMGKRASITMTNVTKHCCSFDWKLRNTQIIAELCKNLKMGTHILLRGCFMS